MPSKHASDRATAPGDLRGKKENLFAIFLNMTFINPYKPGVLFLGHRQTV